MGSDTAVMRSRPDILEAALPWYEAFETLSQSRPIGWAGPLPITIAEVDAFCRLASVPPDDRVQFLRVIRRLDTGFLDLLSKQKSRTVSQPPKGK